MEFIAASLQRLHKVQTVRAVHHGRAAAVGMRVHKARAVRDWTVSMIDRVTSCHQPIGSSAGAGGNFHMTANQSICMGDTGIESAMDNTRLPRYR
jgi:hypothetical protein